MIEYRIPKFNKNTGYLENGICCMTIDELLCHSILGGGKQRKKLILSLKEACEFYWSYGIDEIYANGSFATMKPIPNDIDGYIYLEQNDKRLDEITKTNSIWAKFYGFHNENDKFEMWHKYKIEFYLEFKGQEFFTNFFTHSRDGVERGIIKVIKE